MRSTLFLSSTALAVVAAIPPLRMAASADVAEANFDRGDGVLNTRPSRPALTDAPGSSPVAASDTSGEPLSGDALSRALAVRAAERQAQRQVEGRPAVDLVAAATSVLPEPGRSRLGGTCSRATEASLQLRAHLRARGGEFVELAEWLGGAPWREAARELVAAVCEGRTYAPRTLRLLSDLTDLYMLRRVPHADGAAAGLYVCVDPADRRVVRCCQHAEVLERAQLALRAVDIGARRVARKAERPPVRGWRRPAA